MTSLTPAVARCLGTVALTAISLLLLTGTAAVTGQESPALPDAVSKLRAELEAGRQTLSFDERMGYLPAVLRSLKIPEQSQTLVFSKSSLHRDIVGPDNPRAIYFNDRVYVAYIPGSPQLEFAAVVPGGEPRFYALEQDPDRLAFERDDVCLLCHNPTRSAPIPGFNRLLMRSHYVDRDGHTLQHRDHQDELQFPSHDRVPFEKRWGGWYVTGTHGTQRHLGNLLTRESVGSIGDVMRVTRQLSTEAGANVTSLSGRFDTSYYPSGHSDIVALMVLGHQVEIENLITRAARRGPSDGLAVRALAEALLFAGEAPLAAAIAGTAGYRDVFEASTPLDREGRSLGYMDLERRLLRWPVSFMIYSPSFDALPASVRQEIYRHIDESLAGASSLRGLPTLSDAERTTIRAILNETRPDFAAGLR
ncbi:MAG: hypothetical protein ABL982_11565 [Vicinamibacterales bacterium]